MLTRASKATQSAAEGTWELKVLVLAKGVGMGKESAHRLGALVSESGDIYQTLQMVNK